MTPLRIDPGNLDADDRFIIEVLLEKATAEADLKALEEMICLMHQGTDCPHAYFIRVDDAIG